MLDQEELNKLGVSQEELEEINTQIRLGAYIAVKAVMALWEELKKVDLPEDIKKAILINNQKDGGGNGK